MLLARRIASSTVLYLKMERMGKDFVCDETCILGRIIEKRYRKKKPFPFADTSPRKRIVAPLFVISSQAGLEPLILRVVLNRSQHGVRVKSITNSCRTSDGDQSVRYRRINIFVDVKPLKADGILPAYTNMLLNKTLRNYIWISIGENNAWSFPPSSRVTCFKVAEADANTRFPVSVEPGKADVIDSRMRGHAGTKLITASDSIKDSWGQSSRM